MFVSFIVIFQAADFCVCNMLWFFHFIYLYSFPIGTISFFLFFYPIEGLQIGKLGGIAQVKFCSLSICQQEPVKALQPVAWG